VALGKAAKAGTGCPLGWPEAFVVLLAEHKGREAGLPLPPSGDPAGAGRRRLGADGRRLSTYPAAGTSLAVDAYVPGCFTKRPMSPESVVVKIVVRMSGGEALFSSA